MRGRRAPHRPCLRAAPSEARSQAVAEMKSMLSSYLQSPTQASPTQAKEAWVGHPQDGCLGHPPVVLSLSGQGKRKVVPKHRKTSHIKNSHPSKRSLGGAPKWWSGPPAHHQGGCLGHPPRGVVCGLYYVIGILTSALYGLYVLPIPPAALLSTLRTYWSLDTYL